MGITTTSVIASKTEVNQLKNAMGEFDFMRITIMSTAMITSKIHPRLLRGLRISAISFSLS